MKTGSENKYMPIGMCLGLAIGTAIGAATDNLATYMCVGLALGVCIDNLANHKNRKKEEDASDKED